MNGTISIIFVAIRHFSGILFIRRPPSTDKIGMGRSTKDVRKMGRGVGGFEISDIPGRWGGWGGGGWFVKVRTSENF